MSKECKALMDRVQAESRGMAELAEILVREGKWAEIASFLLSQWEKDANRSGCMAFMTGLLGRCRAEDIGRAFWTVRECMPVLPKRAMAQVLVAMTDLASRSRNGSRHLDECFGAVQNRWTRNGWLPDKFDLAEAILDRKRVAILRQRTCRRPRS